MILNRQKGDASLSRVEFPGEFQCPPKKRRRSVDKMLKGGYLGSSRCRFSLNLHCEFRSCPFEKKTWHSAPGAVAPFRAGVISWRRRSMIYATSSSFRSDGTETSVRFPRF